MGQIPAEKISEIRDRIDIERVVGRSVRLTKRGSRQVGLCPFHGEKTPSFGVSREKQLYHCFGCQAGGDVFNFVMRIEGIEFPEAVRQLAKEAGVALPEEEESPKEKAARTFRERLYQVNELAAAFYAKILEKNARAMTYLTEERALTPETIQRFRLGWAPPEWTSLADLFQKKELDPEVGLAVGLLGKGARDGRIYDRLRGRVVFPIALPGGQVAGFGARRADWIEADAPKYLNSPESPIYDKSSIFYGLATARDEIRRSRRAVLVEGYLDVIGLAQAGIGIAVAACGTALTEPHARMLARLATEVVTCYDGDAAGHEATKKAALVLLGAGVSVRVLDLPDGEDPDTFVRAHGGERFQKLIDEAPSAIDFFVGKARAQHVGGGIAGTTKAVDAVKPLILAIQDPLERDVTIAASARALGLAEPMLRRHLSAKGPRRDPPMHRFETRQPQARQKPLPVVETAILKALVESPAEILTELVARNGFRAFSHAGIRAAVEAAREAHEAGGRLEAPRALEIVREAGGVGEDAIGELRRLLLEELPNRDEPKMCVDRLLSEYRNHALRALEQRLRQETDPAEQARLMAEARDLMAL